MKLEASPIGESNVGMEKFQAQLVALNIQLQDITKEKENIQQVWCYM